MIKRLFVPNLTFCLGLLPVLAFSDPLPTGERFYVMYTSPQPVFVARIATPGPAPQIEDAPKLQEQGIDRGAVEASGMSRDLPFAKHGGGSSHGEILYGSWSTSPDSGGGNFFSIWESDLYTSEGIGLRTILNGGQAVYGAHAITIYEGYGYNGYNTEGQLVGTPLARPTPFSGRDVFPGQMNNSFLTVGSAINDSDWRRRAVFWDLRTVPTPFGFPFFDPVPSGPEDHSKNFRVVGPSEGLPAGAWSNAILSGVNSGNLAVGWALTEEEFPKALLANLNRAAPEESTLVPLDESSMIFHRLLAINLAGTAVGSLEAGWDQPTGVRGPVICRVSAAPPSCTIETVSGLNALPGAPFELAQAVAINDFSQNASLGQMVGSQRSGMSQNFRPFFCELISQGSPPALRCRAPDGSLSTNVQALPQLTNNNRALAAAINVGGMIGGMAWGSKSSAPPGDVDNNAVLWLSQSGQGYTPDKLVRIYDLLTDAQRSVIGSGRLISVTALSNAGHIGGLWRTGSSYKIFYLIPGSSFPPGDTNCDGTRNALDINPFVMALTDADAYLDDYGSSCSIFTADINNDGVINALDIAPFVRLLVNA